RRDVDLEVFDGGVEALLDGGRQTMDLVDEENVVRLQLREQARERALVLDGRARRRVRGDAHLFRDDVRERRLAEPGRAAKEDVIERLAALLRRLDEDAQVVLVVVLPHVLVERRRPEEAVEACIVALFTSGDGSLLRFFLHGKGRLHPY